MSPRPARRSRPSAIPTPPEPDRLAELGVERGDQVRFRRRDSERWKDGWVTRRERDGSVGLHDDKGAARSIPVELIEVRTTGPRGGAVWEPLAERHARVQAEERKPTQLRLL